MGPAEVTVFGVDLGLRHERDADEFILSVGAGSFLASTHLVAGVGHRHVAVAFSGGEEFGAHLRAVLERRSRWTLVVEDEARTGGVGGPGSGGVSSDGAGLDGAASGGAGLSPARLDGVGLDGAGSGAVGLDGADSGGAGFSGAGLGGVSSSGAGFDGAAVGGFEGDSVFLEGAREAAAEHVSRSGGRVVRFAGVNSLVGEVSVAQVLASAIDRVAVLADADPPVDTPVITRDFVRPRWSGGQLVLHTQPARGGTLVPFETPDPTPCCRDHSPSARAGVLK